MIVKDFIYLTDHYNINVYIILLHVLIINYLPIFHITFYLNFIIKL